MIDTRHWALVLFIAAAVAACAGGTSSPMPGGALPAAAFPKGSTPISHVVIVIQENRSFDNFFATFPGANGATTGLAEPMSKSIAASCKAKKQPVITKPATVPLTKVDLVGKGFPGNFGWNNDLPHTYPSGYLAECNSAGLQPSASDPCRMDGFDATRFGPNGEGPQATCTYTYQYVDPRIIAPYWDMAKQYVLADETFQSQGSESFTAHQDLIAAGTAVDATDSIIDDPTGFPWGCDAYKTSVTTLLTTSGKYLQDNGPFPCLTYKTMRDLLDAKGVSWKYYANKVYPWNGKSGGDTSGIWSGFDAISAVRYSKEWGKNVTDSDLQIFTDIKKGHLPSVSWVTPNAPNSDHPNEKCRCDTGPSWVASIVNAIGKSKYWKSTAIVVIWDDWGGYYDHAIPPLYDNQGGLGFRVPMLIVSPYVQAHVEHTQYETTSILKFVEANWALGSLGGLDVRASSIANAFNFDQAPRAFKVIPAKYPLSFFLHQKPSGLPPDSE
ncbi:MAG: hypothetical protein JO104_03275 [Candidatus Eremiobacteraeota bacterium]|nr:hypothetical protein [Candidatus Eremiobacteraeota bacterium]